MATKNEETSEEIKRLKKLLNDLIINNEQSVQSSNEETSEKVISSNHTRLKKLLNDLIEEKDTLSQSVSSPPSKRQNVTNSSRILSELIIDLDAPKASLHGVDEQQSLTESPPKQIKDNVITIDLNTITKKRKPSESPQITSSKSKKVPKNGGKPKSTKPEQKTKSTKTKTK
jgi:hypothetical protein